MSTVFLAGLFHETHSFVDEKTGIEEFSKVGWGTGVDIAVPGSPIGAMYQHLCELGCKVEAGPHYFGGASGTVTDEVVSEWRKSFEDAWRAASQTPEAICLVLHGAMVSENDTDVEATVIEWIRSLPGAVSIPIYAVLDLHANVSRKFTSLMNGFLAYRNNPHTDSVESALRVVDIYALARNSGVQHRAHWRGTSLVWSPSGTGTAYTPMRELEAIARQAEGLDGVVAVNVFAGYSYADMPDTGVTFSIVAEEDCQLRTIEKIFDDLVSEANRLKEYGCPAADKLEGLREAVARNSGKPVVAVEPSDNIGAGAPGDCTGLLRLFLEEGFSSAGVIINDPLAVAALQGVEEGSMASLSIGGRGSRFDPGPLAVEAKLLRLLQGVFDLEDPHSHLASMGGTRVDMGPCAVLTVAGVTILLTSQKTPPFDLGQWRVAGIQPENFSVIGVKAAVGYRQAYDPIASDHLQIETPGPCPLDLRKIPFKNIRRPVYPLDG